MNRKTLILLTTAILLTACNDEPKEAQKPTPYASNELAIMLEKIDDPLAGMINFSNEKNVEKSRKVQGHAGEIISYKECYQSQKKDSLRGYYKGMLEESKEKSEFNDLKSVKKVEHCPLPATAQCDYGNYSKYFYVDSNRILKKEQEKCRGEWSEPNPNRTSDKAKALIVIDGKEHHFETDNNCMMLHRMESIVTPDFRNNLMNFQLRQSYPLDTWKVFYSTPLEKEYEYDNYTTSKHHIVYDEKTIKGTLKAVNQDKSKTVNIEFDINCL